MLCFADVIVGNASRVAQSQHCDALTASYSALKVGRFVEFLFRKESIVHTRRAPSLCGLTTPSRLSPRVLNCHINLDVPSLLNTTINEGLVQGRAPFTMSSLAHGGRIVPILTGHEQPPPFPTTPETQLLDKPPIAPVIDEPSPLGQGEVTLATRQNNAVDQKSLAMPCLEERGLFALPTEGDGKLAFLCCSAACPSCTGV